MSELPPPSDRPPEGPVRTELFVRRSDHRVPSIMEVVNARAQRAFAPAPEGSVSKRRRRKRRRVEQKPVFRGVDQVAHDTDLMQNVTGLMVRERIPFINGTPLGGVSLVEPIGMQDLCNRLQELDPVDFNGVAMILFQRFNWQRINANIIRRLTVLLQNARSSDNSDPAYENVASILRQLSTPPADIDRIYGSSSAAAAADECPLGPDIIPHGKGKQRLPDIE
jgi:hypothetical protein